MLNRLSDPLTLFALILVVGIFANFILVSREAAIQFSLRRNGVVGNAQIVKRYKRGSGRGGPSYWITYEFVAFTTGEKYRRDEMVSFANYRQWQIGDNVHTVVLRNNPRISRLSDDKVRAFTLFGAGAVSLAFPVYFFGISSLLIVFIICLIIFCANLLRINLRGKQQESL
jgi:hypothetical protein